MRVWIAGLVLCVSFVQTSAAEIRMLTDFRHSLYYSSYGDVSEIGFATGLIELQPGELGRHLHSSVKQFGFAEPVWIIGYKAEIRDANSQSPRENYLCHTFFVNRIMRQGAEDELNGIYSDAFTTELRMPEGFGIRMPANEPVYWVPAFNNRSRELVQVRMLITMTLIREKDLMKPLTRLYANLRSVSSPDLFLVAPGRDERSVTFQSPADGRIHVLGTHLHPYGVSVELYNLTRQEQVWIGKRKGGPASAMEVYTSRTGYPIRAAETYRIAAVYDNVTRKTIDAMAGLFMFYSRE